MDDGDKVEIDLYPMLEELFKKLHGQNGEMLWPYEENLDGFVLRKNDDVNESIDFVMTKEGGHFMLGGKNLGYYIPAFLQDINARKVTIEISEDSFCIEADPTEIVLGLYYTCSNACAIPEEEVHKVCKPGTSDTCIFLQASPAESSGICWECLKFDSYQARQLLARYAEGDMNATRIGNCQILGRKED